jgi:hypothetical protein
VTLISESFFFFLIIFQKIVKRGTDVSEVGMYVFPCLGMSYHFDDWLMGIVRLIPTNGSSLKPGDVFPGSTSGAGDVTMTKLRAGPSRNRPSIPGRLWDPPSPYTTETGGSFPGDKAAGASS